MPEGADIATLGLRVDATEFVGAKKAVDDFTAAGAKAERQVSTLSTVTKDQKRAFLEASAAVRGQAAALEREYASTIATIKTNLAQGLVSKKEAERAGREAAQSFNAGLASAINQARSGGAFRPGIKGAQENFVGLADKFKDVGKASRNAGLGLGRLNNSMVVVARNALGLGSTTGRLIDTVGTFAIGTAYMIPVLAGLAAIGLAWQNITEESRKAKKEQDDALASLRKLREAQADEDRGVAGSRRREVEQALEREALVLERLVDLRKQLSRAQASGNRNRVEAAAGRVEDAVEELRGVREDIAAGVREIERAESDLARRSSQTVQGLGINVADQQRILDATRGSAEQLARVTRQLAREAELRKVIADVAEGDRDNAVALVNLKHDLIDAIAEEVRLQKEAADAAKEQLKAIEALHAINVRGRQIQARSSVAGRNFLAGRRDRAEEIRQEVAAAAELADMAARTRAEFEATREAADDILLALAIEDAARASDILSESLKSIGFLFGDVGRAVAGMVDQLLTIETRAKEGGGYESVLTVGNPVAAVGGLFVSALGSIVSGIADHERRVQQTKRRYKDALDAFVDELADKSRLEQLADSALEAGQSLARLALFAGDIKTGGLTAFGEALRAIDEAASVEELLAWVSTIDASSEVVAALTERIRQIAAARAEEIAAMENDLEVRKLRALGLDDEAAQLQLSIQYQRDLAAARELEDDALVELVKEVYKLEQAALAAAAAAEAAAEAQERLTGVGQSIDDVIASNEQARIGREQGQFALDRFNLEEWAEAQRKIIDDQLRAGLITGTEAARYYDALNEAVAGSLREIAIAEQAAADAAKELAAADAFRAQQDLQSLELRRLVALGMEDEAFLLRQQLELEQALFDQRSAQYIELLQLVQAEERAARERAKQAQAAQEQAKALEESTKTIDGMARALNGPAGLVLALRRYQTVLGAGAPNALGIRGPTFGGGAQASINVAPGAIVIEGSNLSPEEIADAVISRITREYRAGGGNRVTNVLG